MNQIDATLDFGALESRDWRTWFGLVSTVFWLFLGILYIDSNVGWKGLATQPAEALGSFLEGAFAPLAFLWLVIGFFIQQNELRHNNRAIRLQYDEMRRATQHAEVQARAISANELHQRQETFLMVADRVHRQLGAVVGMLWMSIQSSAGTGEATEEQIGELWSQYGSGDPEAFARQFLGLHFRRRNQGQSSQDLFFGTEVRRRHSKTIVRAFGRLLESARQCDPEGIITDTLHGSAHGLLYQVVKDEEAMAQQE